MPHTRERPATTLAAWGPPLLVAAITFAVFSRALGNGFVAWDDDRNFLDNLDYRGLSWVHLHWMFTSAHLGHYIPVTWLSLGLDYVLWGMNPAGYHLTNLVLHAASAAVLYLVARRLLRGAVVGSVAAALLFALHPLRVESVAWVTERRDVLSGLAYLLTVLAYLRAGTAEGGRERRRWLCAAVVLFALGVLAKSIVVTLPAVLVVLDVYPLGRLGGARGWTGPSVRGVWTEKVPFLVVALGMTVVAFLAVIASGNLRSLSQVGPLERVAIAAYGAGFYLWKWLVPTGLSPLYALPRPVSRLGMGIVAGAVTVLGVTAGAVAARRRAPWLLAVWVAYLVTLVPVGGLLQNGPQVAADRYTYLSMLGAAVLAGAGVEGCWRRWRRRGPGPRMTRLAGGAGVALAGVVLAVVAGLTWRQIGFWHDGESLWARAVAVSPSPAAYTNYGTMLGREGRLAEATAMQRRALALDPDLAISHHNLGVALLREERWAEARDEFAVAVRLDPGVAKAQVNLGALLVREGRFTEALAHLREAVRLAPNLVEAQYNLGMALDGVGRPDEATARFRIALLMRPDYEPARQALASVQARARGR